jgi:hypothetical protein
VEIKGRATSWRRMVVTLMTMGLNDLNNRPWWGAKQEKLSVQRFMLAIATKRSVAKNFDRSWAYFLARFWGFEGYEHGPRTNTRWMTSLHWLFENLDRSGEVSTSTVSTWLAGKGFDATRSSRLAAWDHVDRTFQKIIMRERKANKRVSTFSCTDNGFVRKLQIIILLTPFLISQILGFWQLVVSKVRYFSSWCDAYACEDTMLMLVRNGAHDAR